MINLKGKIYLNRITVDYQTIYNQAQQYFASHGINITYTFVQSDYKNLTSQQTMLPQGMRVILHPAMSNIVPIDTSYDFTSFCFNGEEFPPPSIPTGYTYVPIRQPFMDILLDARTPEANYLCVIHEMMHCLVYLANEAGFNVPQIMDTYFENDQPNNPSSNFGQQWTLLQPWIASINLIVKTLPQVTITRTNHYTKEIMGQLRTNDGKFGCDSLELCYLNNQQNISAIPPGKYLCQWKFKLNSLAYHYELQNVPNRTGIFIHAGNFFSNSEGCILLGNSPQDINKDGSLDLINSNLMISAFENYMKKVDFELTIL